ncbi:MAG: ATP-dependent zinc metalloprotease FtsH [Roseburia sp.]|nr:ATP-dependent zinc metalloprotease FtsH [Roseburia sp.]
MENNKNKLSGNNPKKNRTNIIICVAAAFFAFGLILFLNSEIQKNTQKEITYTKFIDMLKEGKVEKVTFGTNVIYIEPKAEEKSSLFKVTYYTGYVNDTALVQDMLNRYDVEFTAEIEDTSSGVLEFFLAYILPFVGMWVVLWLLMRVMTKGGGGGGLMGVGKSTAKMYVEKETGVTFKDVAGEEEAKESLTELVDFLKNPDKYRKIGARLPKGALLVGPPGTGKTLLAKALAGEASVPFFSLSGSDFVEMFVGVGASRVRDLFKQAQSMAPCIIFIDEIDAIGKSRDTQYGGGNDEREQTLNQLLSEMDGFDSSKGIVILGATNRPEVLDKALLRPGRFDRRIIVEKPDLKGRIDVLKVHSHDVLMDDTVNLEEIALATSGAVGADLANMVNEAAIMAVKDGRRVVSQKDLFEAVEVVFAGKEKKDRILGEEEKKIVAYHEVGHALVTTLLKNAEPVQKITIVPRTMGALGYVMQVPEEEKYLRKKEELISKIVTLFGGRAAEEIIFGDITTGASNDIEQATSIARAMVTQYGMSEKFGLIGLESIQNRYLDGRAVMNCGDQTESEVDQEVMALLKECYDKAYQIVEEHTEVLHKLAAYLVERETITGKEFVKIFEEETGIVLKKAEDEKAKLSDSSPEHVSEENDIAKTTNEHEEQTETPVEEAQAEKAAEKAQTEEQENKTDGI